MENDFGFSKKLYNSSNIPSVQITSTNPNEIQRNKSFNRISIFSRRKSNSKNNIFFIRNINLKNSNSPFNTFTIKKRTNLSYDSNYNEAIIKNIYKIKKMAIILLN